MNNLQIMHTFFKNKIITNLFYPIASLKKSLIKNLNSALYCTKPTISFRNLGYTAL